MDISLFCFMFFFFASAFVMFSYLLAILQLKFFPTLFGTPRDYKYKPTVTVVISCFNEGKAVYETIKSIKQNNYPQELVDIIAYDDCSIDDSFVWLQKAAVDFPGVVVGKNSENMGKAFTVAKIARLATGEILIGTDSDTIWDSEAIKELVCCFADPKIGGVGGIIGILNSNDSLLTEYQTIMYGSAYYLYKPYENMTRTVQCLGGPLVAFRRKLYMEILPEVEARNFLGEKITNGEDRTITQLILFRGYKTFCTFKAKCWVTTPRTWKVYFNQQLRWRRSAVGQWVDCLFHLPQRIYTGGVSATVGSLLNILINFMWIVFGIYLISIGQFLTYIAFFVVIHATIMILLGAVFNATIGKHDSIQKLQHPMIAAIIYSLWFPFSSFILTPWAAWTLDDGGWVTRLRSNFS